MLRGNKISTTRQEMLRGNKISTTSLQKADIGTDVYLMSSFATAEHQREHTADLRRVMFGYASKEERKLNSIL